MNNAQQSFTIGDAVLVDFNGALIPGVIEDEQDGRFRVKLAEAWADETGTSTDSQWLDPARLSPDVGGDTQPAELPDNQAQQG